MDFGLSDDQKLLQDTVRTFVAKECPIARVREVVDGDSGHAPEVWQGMAELGLAGLVVPERFGGAGLGVLDAALVGEVLGEAATPGPFLGHTRAGVAIALGGDAAARERFLPGLASGERVGSVAFAEDAGVWGPDGWTAPVADGRISGAKPYVPAGRLADVLVVGTAGGGLAVVESAAGGVTVEAQGGVDPTRRLDRVELAAAPCVPLASRDAAARTIAAGLALLGADAFGGASRLVELSADYARTRQQFDQPIAQFQAIKHQLANMTVEVESARGLFWYAAYAVDEEPGEYERAAALAKAHLTDRFMDVARNAVEVHGGIGFTWECDVQIWFKRAMFDRAFLGTPALHRERCAVLAGW